MHDTNLAKNYFGELAQLLKSIDTNSINKVIEQIIDAIKMKRKILVCGNGGSALTASHFITDWNKMYNLAHNKELMGFSLSDNVGLITAYSNDLCFEEIYSGQIKSIGAPKDILIAISGSGNSQNVINAVNTANSIGMTSIAIVGFDGGKLKKVADTSIHVKCNDMQLCEDIHLSIGHIIMKAICEK